MHRVAFVGDSGTALPFRFIEADFFIIDGPGELEDLTSKLLSGGYALIIMAEELYISLKKIMPPGAADKLTFLPVPAYTGRKDIVEGLLKDLVIKALGADILYKKEVE